MLLDLIEFFLFCIPLLYFWNGGRLKATIQFPTAEPMLHTWRPVALVVVLLTLYLAFGWWSVLAEHGLQGMLKFQGAPK